MQTSSRNVTRVIQRNISDEIADAVREMIVDGRMEAGSRVNEVHLAAALGVSRTPLREALMQLRAEGALTVLARSGFFVTPLSLEEFRQIYPIRVLLDPEALRLSGRPPKERLARLEALNAQIRRAAAPARVIALDDIFHLELVAGCPNAVLIALIRQFMLRTRRYELALMRAKKSVNDTADAHEKILKQLRAGDLRAACAALRSNLEIGRAPIEAWLKERESR